MTDEHSDLPRRRQASPDALAGREAAALVRELNRRLGQWQASSVKIHTMAERITLTGKPDPAITAEAVTLFQAVQAEAVRFEQMLPEHPAAVTQHGRIKDTRRSFEMVTDRLRASLRLLGESGE